jgi:hypothetical protein
VESNLLSTGTGDFLATNDFASQSGDVWFSFTLLVDSSVNNSRYWFWVSDTTDINTGITGAIADNNTGSKVLQADVRNITASNSATATGFEEDSVLFLVGRLSKDGPATNLNAYDRMELWVNPTSLTLGAASATANGTTAYSFTEGVANFGLTTLSTAADLQWDNLRVGTSQADVVNNYLVIPEPSAGLLLGLGAMGLVLRRRRS